MSPNLLPAKKTKKKTAINLCPRLHLKHGNKTMSMSPSSGCLTATSASTPTLVIHGSEEFSAVDKTQHSHGEPGYQ